MNCLVSIRPCRTRLSGRSLWPDSVSVPLLGLSPWPCDILPMATVEIACLKINCSWLLVSSTTEYLSNELIRTVIFTPLKR